MINITLLVGEKVSCNLTPKLRSEVVSANAKAMVGTWVLGREDSEFLALHIAITKWQYLVFFIKIRWQFFKSYCWIALHYHSSPCPRRDKFRKMDIKFCDLCLGVLHNYKFPKKEGNEEAYACSKCRHLYLCVDQVKPEMDCNCIDEELTECWSCTFESYGSFGMNSLQNDSGKS